MIQLLVDKPVSWDVVRQLVKEIEALQAKVKVLQDEVLALKRRPAAQASDWLGPS